MAKMPDGMITMFSTEDMVTIKVHTKDLVLCKHCFRHDTHKCSFFLTDTCFKPSDNFVCAFGEVEKNE